MVKQSKVNQSAKKESDSDEYASDDDVSSNAKTQQTKKPCSEEVVTSTTTSGEQALSELTSGQVCGSDDVVSEEDQGGNYVKACVSALKRKFPCESGESKGDDTWEPAMLPAVEKVLRMHFDPKLAKGAFGEYGGGYQGARPNKCNCCGHYRQCGTRGRGGYMNRRTHRGDDKDKTESGESESKKLDSNQIKQLVTDHKCIICAVEFTSTVQRKQHIEGRKHKKRLKFLIDNGSEDLLPSLEKAAQEAAEAAASNADSDGNSEDNIDEDGDIEMDDIDDHSAFEEGLAFLRSVCKSQRDQNKLTQIAFELFRMMEDYLRFLTKCYVSPGLDPRRMSWNELLNVLKRNTVNRLSSSFDRKLDNVRQLRNSVVHSFSMSLSEDGLGKIFSIADDLVIWGRGFKMNATTVYPKATDGTAPNIYEGLYRRHFQ